MHGVTMKIIGAYLVKDFSSQLYEIQVNRGLPQNTTV